MKNIAKITLLAVACFIVSTALAQNKVKTIGEKTTVTPKPVSLKAPPVKPGSPTIHKVERVPARDVTTKPSSTQKIAINEEGLTHDDKAKVKKSACKPGCAKSCCSKRGVKAKTACKPGCNKDCCTSHKNNRKRKN